MRRDEYVSGVYARASQQFVRFIHVRKTATVARLIVLVVHASVSVVFV